MILYTSMIILPYCIIHNKVLNTVNQIERLIMTKAHRAGDAPIAVEVEKDKSYYWCHLWKKFKTTILRWYSQGFRIYSSSL